VVVVVVIVVVVVVVIVGWWVRPHDLTTVRLLLQRIAKLIADGVPHAAACEAAVTRCMTDDPEMQDAIAEIVTGIF